jgi:hypothetical protein
MLTLGAPVELIRRFIGKMSAITSLSDEKTTTVEQLFSNMTRASEMTAELEAHVRGNASEYPMDGEEGEDEFLAISTVRKTHDESDGARKFQTLLRNKSAPRGKQSRRHDSI